MKVDHLVEGTDLTLTDLKHDRGRVFFVFEHVCQERWPTSRCARIWILISFTSMVFLLWIHQSTLNYSVKISVSQVWVIGISDRTFIVDSGVRPFLFGQVHLIKYRLGSGMQQALGIPRMIGIHKCPHLNIRGFPFSYLLEFYCLSSLLTFSFRIFRSGSFPDGKDFILEITTR